MKTILEILKLSSEYLANQGFESPRREAELLLSDFLKIGRMDLYLDFERPLTEKELEQFRERLKRRKNLEPGQYIHGSVIFYGLELKINKAVLIPRPETEILVDKIVKELSKYDLKGKTCLDLCSGSGCIGLALKKQLPDLEMFLTDISEEALLVAKENAKTLDLNVHFFQGDLFSPFPEQKFDYIVCNPPYISEDEYEELSHEVKNFEPKMALLGGKTGLEFYHRLSQDLNSHINRKGKVWLEIGSTQGKSVSSLFPAAHLEKDWAGHDRYISLEFE